MKKLLTCTLGVLLSVSFFQCEDSENSPQNYFTYNSDVTPLKSGTIRSIQTLTYPESEQVVYEWDIFLSSGKVNNKKNWVRFILNSSDINDVPVGTYTYDEEYKNHEMDDFSFYITSILRNGDLESQEGEVVGGDLAANMDFETGTVTVAKTEDVYSITFSITLDNGDVCEGKYTGKLTLREPLTH